jgi:hypothetical protein
VTSLTRTTNDTRHENRTDYAERMYRIQLDFIDDPRKAALDANGLARALLETVAGKLAQLRMDLAAKPVDGAPETEQLRQAVRRYRDFVDALAQSASSLSENGQSGHPELPEETTYRVGENGEAEPFDPSELKAFRGE